MQALLSDGPLGGRKIGVDVSEGGTPPQEMEVDVEDGCVHVYALDRADGPDGVAVYTHRDTYDH